jgi:hypothetical protein
MKKTKIFLGCLAAGALVGLVACGGGTGGDDDGDDEVKTIDLTLWNGGDEAGWYALNRSPHSRLSTKRKLSNLTLRKVSNRSRQSKIPF